MPGLGEPLVRTTPREGWAELVRRYLRSFGPATEDDVVWWLGSTKTAVRGALADMEALTVELEHGKPADVLADDLEEESSIEPWAALLPTLDPTMGWKARDFYLDTTDVSYLFDKARNAGPTASWTDGSSTRVFRTDPPASRWSLPARCRMPLAGRSTTKPTASPSGSPGTRHLHLCCPARRQRTTTLTDADALRGLDWARQCPALALARRFHRPVLLELWRDGKSAPDLGR